MKKFLIFILRTFLQNNENPEERKLSEGYDLLIDIVPILRKALKINTIVKKK